MRSLRSATANPEHMTAGDEHALDVLVGEDTQPRKSQADKLDELAEHVNFFHQDIDEPFAAVRVDAHLETWGIHSKVSNAGFRTNSTENTERHRAPDATQDALNVLSGRAIYDGPQIAVQTRVAEADDATLLDLANPEWSAVQITEGGWQVIQEVPVTFVRTRGTQTIPKPARGGNLDELQEFINIPDTDPLGSLRQNHHRTDGRMETDP